MEKSRARFYNIVHETTLEEHERSGIGTYKEKRLHVIMKKLFASENARFEVPLCGYIADIYDGERITEIETGGFTGLSPKLRAYLPEHKVTLVYPIAAKKYVSWIDPDTAEISSRRISPKKGSAYDLLYEMVYILPHVKAENLTAVGVLMEMDEYRMLDGWDRSRKRGSHRYEKIPTELCDTVVLSTDEDYRRYIPDGLPEEFTAKEFAKAARIQYRLATAVVKVLSERGLIEKLGKRGRSYIYRKI